jgi:hypothetical protein
MKVIVHSGLLNSMPMSQVRKGPVQRAGRVSLLKRRQQYKAKVLMLQVLTEKADRERLLLLRLITNIKRRDDRLMFQLQHQRERLQAYDS